MRPHWAEIELSGWPLPQRPQPRLALSVSQAPYWVSAAYFWYRRSFFNVKSPFWFSLILTLASVNSVSVLPYHFQEVVPVEQAVRSAPSQA